MKCPGTRALGGRGWAGVVIRVRGGRPGRSHGSTPGHRSTDTACCPLRGAENHKTKKTLIPILTLVSSSRIAICKVLCLLAGIICSACNVRPWWAAAPVPPVPAVAQQPRAHQAAVTAAPEGNSGARIDQAKGAWGGVLKTTGEEDHESVLPLHRST